MQLCFLDTSALTDLVAPDAAFIRHRLIDRVNGGNVVVLGTAPLLLELSGTYEVDAPKHLAMVDLFHRISRGSHFLLDPPTRRERELRCGRGLIYPDFVESRFEPSLEVEAIGHAAAAYAGYSRGMRFAEAEKAADAIRALDDLERQAALAVGSVFDLHDPQWRRTMIQANRSESYALRLAEDYARIAIDRFAPTVGITDTETLGARALPTFWCSALIHVARIRAVVLGGTSPTGNKSVGQLDLIHLEEAASYADLFVTSDCRLRAFAKEVRGLRCQVLSFDDWAAALT